MERTQFIALAVLAANLAAVGCSDNPARPSETFAVLLSAGQEPFSTEVPDARHLLERVPGPFALSGTNVRYDADLGALLVDLSVANLDGPPLFEPVGLIFQSLSPRGVVVLNAEDGASGPGARLEFEFADGDDVWSPGESSLPRTVQFAVAPGEQVGFGGDLSVTEGPLSGVIGGLVWHDRNEDGLQGPDELGLPGVRLAVESTQPASRVVVVTGAAGDFAVGRLPAATYTVGCVTTGLTATTAAPLTLTLSLQDGGVSARTGAAIGLLLGLPPEVVRAAGADAAVRTDLDTRRNDNYGANPFVMVGGSRGGGGLDNGDPDGMRTLVYFPLDDIPVPVRQATLELTVANYQEGVNQAYRIDVHGIVESGSRTPWAEGEGSEVTPLPLGTTDVNAAAGVAWIGAGDGGDPNNQTQPDFAPAAGASASFDQSARPPGSVIRWDVTGPVNAWITGAAPNHGLLLRDITSDGTFRELWFGARDGLLRGFTDSRVQPGPRLVLDLSY